MGRARNGQRLAPVSSVLQSPKDMPLDFFQDVGRPLSARMSDRPGGAFSGLRPQSFQRVKAPARSRVSSIEEEDLRVANGQQPLVSHSLSGGFGRSESSIGGDRPISSRRITGSKSGEREGRGSSRGDRESRRRRSRSRSKTRGGGQAGGSSSSRTASTAAAANAANAAAAAAAAAAGGGRGAGGAAVAGAPGGGGGGGGGGRGSGGSNGSTGSALKASSPPSTVADRTQTLLRSQHNSVGTTLHPMDRVRSATAVRNSDGLVVTAAAVSSTGGKVTSAAPRRATISGVSAAADAAAAAASLAGGGESAFDSPRDTHSSGTILPRRTSASHIPSMAAAVGGSNFDSVTTIGTPGATMTRALTRAATARAGNGFAQRGGSAMAMSMSTTGGGGIAVLAARQPPKNLREAIDAGDVLAVGSMVRAMTRDEAKVELVAQDREQGTPLMQAAAGKNAQTYRAVMDAIRSRLGVETLVRNTPDTL